MGGASPDDLVFATVEGGPRDPDDITREWRRAVKSKKLPKVTFHALRHTHVSQLIASGMDGPSAGGLVTAHPTITLSVYGDLFKNTDASAAAIMEAAIGVRTE